jgi:hypothetical protein
VVKIRKKSKLKRKVRIQGSECQVRHGQSQREPSTEATGRMKPGSLLVRRSPRRHERASLEQLPCHAPGQIALPRNSGVVSGINEVPDAQPTGPEPRRSGQWCRGASPTSQLFQSRLVTGPSAQALKLQNYGSFLIPRPEAARELGWPPEVRGRGGTPMT